LCAYLTGDLFAIAKFLVEFCDINSPLKLLSLLVVVAAAGRQVMGDDGGLGGAPV